jgi:hypothetical protein
LLARDLLFGIIVLFLALSSCSRQPESFPPPQQRREFTGPDPIPILDYIEMSEPWADNYVVRDIMTGSGLGEKRWAFENPELRFQLRDTRHCKLVVKLGVPTATYSRTGPITVQFFVNGKPVGKIRCPNPGEYRFEAPVPAEWLVDGAQTLVSAKTDKLWIAESDGAKLSFLLYAVGFMPQ